MRTFASFSFCRMKTARDWRVSGSSGCASRIRRAARAEAQLAGVMGAKRTPELIPLCHPLALDCVDLTLTLNEETCAVEIRAEVACTGRTGVEMEAMTAAAVAALTVYDMCKAVQRDIVIRNVRLLEKTGGIHGDYRRIGL